MKVLRRAIETETNAALIASQKRPKKQYLTLEAAVDARVKIVTTYPGTQTLSREAATSLVSR